MEIEAVVSFNCKALERDGKIYVFILSFDPKTRCWKEDCDVTDLVPIDEMALLEIKLKHAKETSTRVLNRKRGR